MTALRDLPGAVPDTPAVHAALADPETLLAAARTAGPGWSEPYGGPVGVAQLTSLIRDRQEAQAKAVAALRSTAVAELVRDRSLSAVGALLGIGKTAVHKLTEKALDTPFNALITKGEW